MPAAIDPVLSKLTIQEPNKWLTYIDAVERTVNSTALRSTRDILLALHKQKQMRNKNEKSTFIILEAVRVKSVMDLLKIPIFIKKGD